MDFKTHLLKYLSKDEINSLIHSFSLPENKGFFINSDKISSVDIQSEFKIIHPHDFIDNSFLFVKNEDSSISKNILHELGAYYIQDPSATLVPFILKPNEDDFLLDMCAAPGGKSIYSSILMKNKGTIISNDISRSRLNKMLQNVERMGRGNICITNYDFINMNQKYKNKFSKIILDAPCSGSGMFKRDEKMVNDWSYNKVLKYSQIQKDMILNAYDMLKPGGYMTYSTCSYSYEENEEVILHLKQYRDIILEPIFANKMFYRSTTLPEAIHLFPNIYYGEGHFICLIKKPGVLVLEKQTKINYSRNKINKLGNKITENYSISSLLSKEDISHSLRPGLLENVLEYGKYVPSHHLAKYSDATTSIALKDEQFKKYLKGETLEFDMKNGYYFVSYKGINIGVVYIINGIGKNLLPKGLRF